MVDLMKKFMVDTSMEQMVEKPTRLATLGNVVVKTLVDHYYVTVPQSYSTP